VAHLRANTAPLHGIYDVRPIPDKERRGRGGGTLRRRTPFGQSGSLCGLKLVRQNGVLSFRPPAGTLTTLARALRRGLRKRKPLARQIRRGRGEPWIKDLSSNIFMFLLLILTACQLQAEPTSSVDRVTPMHPQATLVNTPLPTDVPSPSSESSPVTNDPLDHTAWILQSLYGRPSLKDAPIILNFSEGFAYGEAGCNMYFNGDETMKYEISANGDLKVYFVYLARQCPSPEGVMEQEETYFKALNSVTGCKLTEDRLELKDESGEIILVFTKDTRPK
jgi:heat shock protein HslJ